MIFTKKFKNREIEVVLFDKSNLTPNETTEWFDLMIQSDHSHSSFHIYFMLFNYTIIEITYYNLKKLEEKRKYKEKMIKFEEEYTNSDWNYLKELEE